jgi:hypothetical protein
MGVKVLLGINRGILWGLINAHGFLDLELTELLHFALNLLYWPVR